MGRERRVVRHIIDKPGTLTDDAGNLLNVQFSLTQWQDFIEDLPSLRSAAGSISFETDTEAWAAADGKKRTLRGAGIEAEVYVVSTDSFKVTGPVRDV